MARTWISVGAAAAGVAAIACTPLPPATPGAGLASIALPLPPPAATAPATPALPAPTPAPPAPSQVPVPTSATTSPSPTAKLLPTPVPVPSYPVNSHLLITSGWVASEDGTPLDGASVSVRSNEASVPYRATARTTEGSWVVPSLPEGITFSLTATAAGFTRRTRTLLPEREMARNVVNFGIPNDCKAMRCQPSDMISVLSPYPEVEAVERGNDGRTAVVRFSHRFNPLEQARLGASIRAFVAVAPPSGAPEAQVEHGTSQVGWSVEGDALTYTLHTAAPPDTVIGFLAPTDGAPIVALGPESPREGLEPGRADGLPRWFGADRAGKRGGALTGPGTLLQAVFYTEAPADQADLDRDGTLTAAEVWAATHATVARWPSP